MNLVLLLEGVAVLFSCGALAFLIRPGSKGSGEHSWLLLVFLLALQAIVHLSDVIEWMGFLEMDQVGDDLRVIVPVLWILALFSRQRELIADDVATEKSHMAFLMEESPLALCVFEENGPILDVSGAWASNFQVARSDLIGSPFRNAEKIPRALRRAVTRALAKDKGRIASEEPLFLRWGGKEDWIEWHMHTSRRLPELPQRVTLWIQFVTSREEREHTARQAASRLQEEHRAELVGHLAASVAHDLRNFLSAITMSAELLPEDDPNPDVVEARAAILNASATSSELVSSLNSLSRPRSARKELDLVELVTSTVGLVRRSLPPGIVVNLALGEEPTIVVGDTIRLQQALVNLIINARDAMGEAGTLDVSVERKPKRAVLTVRDSGPGIPEDVLPKIFERFFTTKGDANGTGLGLTLVQTVAREHRGKVVVESKVGVGATFYFHIPLHEAPSGDATISEPPDADLPPSSAEAAGS